MDARPGLPTRLLMGLVRGYQLLFSAWLRAGCRYSPSCSNYAMQALRQHGACAGTYLAAARILRCNPLCLGGHDPVPDNPPRLFTRLTGCRPGRTQSTAKTKASP
ncbi:membrane protein insertion efficiency factor YidD [Roseateles aquatilis]|uniref:Putative membrane protein insertion efficiency factor n=1 Tax=Roseateles aquatilis TaxID=431061 RepID=A0A246J8K4_9BURK|nr:membrane protein insertion efficiency factor YidD [Roseateles aquatilis]OWQ88574.1 membrane protein insertion efficiency factor YidD [Roseateles aquatilis]